MGKFYYAVRKGKTPGIYETWGKCEEQVKGYSGAEYKKFPTYEEALSFIDGGNEEIELLDENQLKENEAIAYVDGSFDIRNSTYSYGVVFITLDGKETYSGREDNEGLAEMRNVSGEIKGAMVAMDLAIENGKDTLYLHFDYTGIEQWAKGNWKTNKDGTKFYKEFYDSIRDKLNVVFIKVKAHSGIEYNEEADKLAKEAIIV
ncbi:ribonuclease H family protein [Tissierella carlieri]|uniref:ribonuclease H n=1 Tax=Tissierella carlieri TaxID=689904 RepID=A0ABT1S9Z1_9FIRM|nr:ribonuclease H family protein [Tissierella carlieri]MCQ4923281.1 ribonuclease H family protein [Tissierella carlieri]